jgi:hypothetical protein
MAKRARIKMRGVGKKSRERRSFGSIRGVWKERW